MTENPGLIDDFHSHSAENGNRWRYFSDRVMGGVSDGEARYESVQDRQALRLQGSVSLENNGGFIQVALDLGANGGSVDASGFTGIAISLCGDGQRYAVNLRSDDTRRPWQSYRCAVVTTSNWQTHYLPFSAFEAHRIDRPLNTRRLRRVGLIAIGAAGAADVAMASIGFYHA